MLSHLRANLLLLVLTVLLCCVAYPVILLVIGQTVFHDKAQGSLIFDKDGKPIGSLLIAQPFTGEGYFQPRPSAVSYNAAGSGASNWGANNYLLRDRVARVLGPIVKYRSGAKKGNLVGPDIETWFQRDLYQGNPGIVAQWAAAHPTLAANWVKIEPVLQGSDIQAIFFDMWRQEHADADLEPVPADMVMASGSGLDPHITLKNALYQLDRVAAKRAADTNREPAQVRKEIEDLLQNNKSAPLGGLVGVDLVNVLEVNLALREKYESKSRDEKKSGFTDRM